MEKIILLPEEDIGRNLKKALDFIGVNQAKYAEQTGRTPQAISAYIKAKQGCFPSNLLQEIVMLGFNGTWYLTGEGEVWQKDVRGTDSSPEELMFARVGSKFAEAIELLNGASVEKKESVEKAETFSGNLDSNSTQLNSTRSTPCR